MIRSSKTPKCHRRASRRVPLAAVGVSLMVVLALGGCAVGPDFKPPAAPADERYTPEHLASPGSGGRERVSGQRFAEGADVPARWWNAFKSPALNDIVERSLGRNPSLEAALAAIEVERANTDHPGDRLLHAGGKRHAADLHRRNAGSQAESRRGNAEAGAGLLQKRRRHRVPERDGPLRALQQDARAVNSAVAAESAASRLLDIVRGQLQAGQVNQFALLNAQQSYLQATLSRIRAESNRLADSVALFTALGGGLDTADL
jgi:outer membrane protein TolC